jgi:hypothetical protein
MTSHSHPFTNYSSYPDNEKIKITDDNFSSITRKRLIIIFLSIILKFVLHVPKLTKDCNFHVIFYYSICIFQDQNSRNVIGSARMIDGFYYLDNNFNNNKKKNLKALIV